MGKTFSTGLLTNGLWQDTSNNIGIGGSPSGSYKLEVTGTAKVSGAATFSSTISATVGTFTSNNGLVLNSADAAYATFQKSGTTYGFIGTAGSGTDIITGAASGDMVLRSSQKILFSTNNGASANLTITSAGNVGIGNTGNATIRLYLTGVDATSSNYTIYANSSTTNLFYIRNDGLINVGTFTYGNSTSGRPVLVESGGGLGYNASTRESKKNIETINNISWIAQLNPVSFNKRKKGKDGNYSEEIYEEVDYGFIADEVEKVNSDFVFYNNKEDGIKELAGVKYESMTAVLVKAIQEQQAMITSLQDRLDKAGL